MFEFSSRWKSVTDKGKWTARGASFVAKAKATKAVWFPPEPTSAGEKTGRTAKNAAKGATKKAAAAKKATKGATKRSTAAGN